MAPPDLTSNIQKYWFYFTVAYASYKALQTISDLSKNEHKSLVDSSNLQKPKSHISPQFFVNEKGLWIHHRDWILPQQISNRGLSQPKGVVIISHGLGEHIGRYEHFSQVLNSQGFAVYGIDHQGHGQSEGDRCYVRNFNDYVEDLLLFSERIRMEYNSNTQNGYDNVKLFLFGHSMGGLIAALAAHKAQTKYNKSKNGKLLLNGNVINSSNSSNSSKENFNKTDNDKSDEKSDDSSNSIEGPLYDGGVIFSSPAFGVAPEQDLPPTAKNIARKLAGMVPKFPMLELNNEKLSHDPTVLYRLEKDPLHFRGKIPLQTAKELLDHIDILKDIVKNGGIRYPFLVYGGTKDELTYPPSWEEFYNNASSEDKSFQVFDGLYHESLNEIESEQQKVINVVLRWILKRVGEEQSSSTRIV